MGYNLQAVCCTEIAAVVLASVLFFCRNGAISDNKYGDRVFNGLILLTIFAPLNEMFSYFLIGVPGRIVTYASWAMDCLCYISTAGFAYLWAIYTDIRMYNSKTRVSRHKWFAIPLIIDYILILSSPFTGWVFGLEGNNEYVRGPLMMLTYIIPSIYIIFSLVEVFLVSRKKPSFKFYPYVMFATFSFAGMGLQVLIYGIAVIWLAAAFAITLTFIQLQGELRFRDTVTGMFNRGQFDLVMKDVLSGKKSLIGIMVDIDQFRRINEKWGHTIGDFAISEVAEILSEKSVGKWMAIHYSVDTFVLLSSRATYEEAEAMVKEIGETIEKRNADVGENYGLSVSMGIGTIEAGDYSYEKFLKEMEANVDKVKQNKYVRYDG